MARTIYVKQGSRERIEFRQGEVVERNPFYMEPDKVTPFEDLAMCTAIMQLREYPDDPEPLGELSTENGRIGLSSTGQILWQLPPDVSLSLGVESFSGDLFIVLPDGNPVFVIGYDFAMTPAYTWVGGEEG